MKKTRIDKVHGFSFLFQFTFKILTRIMMKSLGEVEKKEEEEKSQFSNKNRQNKGKHYW